MEKGYRGTVWWCVRGAHVNSTWWPWALADHYGPQCHGCPKFYAVRKCTVWIVNNIAFTTALVSLRSLVLDQEMRNICMTVCTGLHCMQIWRLQILFTFSAFSECPSSIMQCWNAVSVVCCITLSAFQHCMPPHMIILEEQQSQRGGHYLPCMQWILSKGDHIHQEGTLLSSVYIVWGTWGTSQRGDTPHCDTGITNNSRIGVQQRSARSAAHAMGGGRGVGGADSGSSRLHKSASHACENSAEFAIINVCRSTPPKWDDAAWYR